MENKIKIYLDDIRTPIDVDWCIVRTFDEFVEKINNTGLENIEQISLDHDLGIEAMNEYYTNTKFNNHINYNNITEKTGYDAAKYLINKAIDENTLLPYITVHSANAVGSENITSYINNYYKSIGQEETCLRIRIPFKVEINGIYK
jgi:disulfide oxidoreductase YuzD